MNLYLQDFLNLTERVINQINPDLAMHHVRVAYIALQLAEKTGLSKKECAAIYTAAWLHDVGVAVSKDRNIIFPTPVNENKDHEKKGALLLKNIEIFKSIAPIVENHHLSDQEYNHYGIKNQIVHVADRMELILRRFSGRISVHADTICDLLLAEHSYIGPKIEHAIDQLRNCDYFWYTLDSRNHLITVSKNSPAKNTLIPPSDFLEATSLIGYVIDTFSGFTHMHSHSVGDISNLIAVNLGFSSNEATLVHSAGFLHDVGKLCVPSNLLEKKGPLSNPEYMLVKQHSFSTMEMFENSPSLKKIGIWASQHHERLDGSGYPYGLTQDELEFESKIIMVADIFTAMIEPRPYKKSKKPLEAIGELKTIAKQGKISSAIVAVLEKNLHAASQLIKDF